MSGQANTQGGRNLTIICSPNFHTAQTTEDGTTLAINMYHICKAGEAAAVCLYEKIMGIVAADRAAQKG